MAIKKKAAKKKVTKNKVYEITFHETEMQHVIEPWLDNVGDIIEGEIDNCESEIKEFNITVKVRYMTDKQLNSLPEYEP